jgi:hypothetical protein
VEPPAFTEVKSVAVSPNPEASEAKPAGAAPSSSEPFRIRRAANPARRHEPAALKRHQDFEPMPHAIEYVDHTANATLSRERFRVRADRWRDGVV